MTVNLLLKRLDNLRSNVPRHSSSPAQHSGQPLGAPDLMRQRGPPRSHWRQPRGSPPSSADIRTCPPLLPGLPNRHRLSPTKEDLIISWVTDDEASPDSVQFAEHPTPDQNRCNRETGRSPDQCRARIATQAEVGRSRDRARDERIHQGHESRHARGRQVRHCPKRRSRPSRTYQSRLIVLYRKREEWLCTRVELSEEMTDTVERLDVQDGLSMGV